MSTSPASRDAYYAAAASWAEDRGAELRASRRTAWIVACGAMLVAVCEGLALMALTPLKTVVPYTLMVDRQTGFVQALKPLDPQKVAPDTALTQSFLVQYVIAREGFDFGTIQSDYRKVGLWSSGAARDDYVRQMQPTNPEGPLARLPRSTVLNVEIKSVTALKSGMSMVRFLTRRHDANGGAPVTQHWVSVVDYRYVGEPASLADRLVNPLGFQVTAYRRSAETPPPSQIEATAPAPSADVEAGA